MMCYQNESLPIERQCATTTLAVHPPDAAPIPPRARRP
jgi:hypothetical protein